MSVPDRAAGLAGRVALVTGAARGFGRAVALAREAQVRALIERTLERFGRLDVLVNNAGIMTRGAFADAPVTDHEQMWATNVIGTFLCAQYALRPMMTARAGYLTGQVQRPNGGWVMA